MGVPQGGWDSVGGTRTGRWWSAGTVLDAHPPTPPWLIPPRGWVRTVRDALPRSPQTILVAMLGRRIVKGWVVPALLLFLLLYHYSRCWKVVLFQKSHEVQNVNEVERTKGWLATVSNHSYLRCDRNECRRVWRMNFDFRIHHQQKTLPTVVDNKHCTESKHGTSTNWTISRMTYIINRWHHLLN